MAKMKNKKKNLAEHVNTKRKSGNAKTLNPFEVHINKEKMRVLGKKLKNDRGLPGVSRAKALKKRKNTLLQEFKLQNKSNKFFDKRIGERNSGLTEEDRAMARFTAVRARAHKKKSIFNLADDEILTHRGQTLNEIEKFDDPRSDDESLDGEPNSGKLDSDFVEDAHFGGGVLSRGTEGFKSHKDLINQLIAESKKRKAEKQKTKEKTLELTEKLDSDWKDLIPIVNKHVKQPNETTKSEIDDYDKAVRELKFEARGHPSDRLKTEDEIAKEEREKLEKLEKERLARMRGFVDERKPEVAKHRSADDLDDDFAYDSDPDVMLSYNDKGESNIVLDNDKNEGDENDQNEIEDAEESDEEIETDSEDDLSDLKEESSDSEDADKNEKPEKQVSGVGETKDSQKRHLEKNIDNEEEEENKKQKTEDLSQKGISDSIKADLLRRKEMMEKARKELPYTFSLPESYEDLQKVFKNQPPEHQSVIIERMIKCNHPSLGENNKEKLGMLFVYLLQYINDISTEIDVKDCFKILSCLIPQLFDLSELNKENAHQSILEVMKEKHLEYRKNKRAYPTLEILMFLKIISCLFTTSDFRHQIVTPCIVFIEQMLHKCKLKTESDIAYGLFLTTLLLEYTSLSKRYLPAGISFLSGILHMAIPKSGVKLIKVLPPFRSTSSALVLYKNCSAVCMSLKLEVSDLTQTEITEDFKIRSLYTVLKLLQEFIQNFNDYPSQFEIFENVLYYVKQIPMPNYPVEVQNELKHLGDSLKKVKDERKLDYIIMAAKKPKALRLYEPIIERVFDTKKHRVMSKEKAEREKLLHKIKKERKGALREIRRDKEFLGRIKIKQKIRSDMERRDKVKQIFAEASMQQSELNALDRKKKRKN